MDEWLSRRLEKIQNCKTNSGKKGRFLYSMDIIILNFRVFSKKKKNYPIQIEMTAHQSPIASSSYREIYSTSISYNNLEQ